jgi:SAM-dependent methyltransferase
MQNQHDPTDWENCYRTGTTPWEKGSPAPPLLEYLGSNQIGGRILVPGCGFGHDVRALSGADREAQVVGLDISESAIAAAEKQPKVGGEHYVLADLFDLPAELRGSFDHVFEHTCLSALPLDLRPDYVEAFRTALKPGGTVIAIFFLTPWDEGETPQPPPYGVTKEELDAMFHEGFTLQEESVPTLQYPGREGRELMRIYRRD